MPHYCSEEIVDILNILIDRRQFLTANQVAMGIADNVLSAGKSSAREEIWTKLFSKLDR